MSEGEFDKLIKDKGFNCWDSETTEEYAEHDKLTGGDGVLNEASMSVDYEDVKAILDKAKKECPIQEYEMASFPYGNFKPLGIEWHLKHGKSEKDLIDWVLKWFGSP